MCLVLVIQTHTMRRFADNGKDKFSLLQQLNTQKTLK